MTKEHGLELRDAILKMMYSFETLNGCDLGLFGLFLEMQIASTPKLI